MRFRLPCLLITTCPYLPDSGIADQLPCSRTLVAQEPTLILYDSMQVFISPLHVDNDQRETIGNSTRRAVRCERGQLSSPVRGQAVRRRRPMHTDLRQVQVRV
jgi:hypothetical protein